jgi:hypothetical protein
MANDEENLIICIPFVSFSPAVSLYERYSILNAYFLPGVSSDSIPLDISPVNSLRFIFNSYFNTDLELLPNRQYFSTAAHFYEFEDVTGQTQAICKIDVNKTP